MEFQLGAQCTERIGAARRRRAPGAGLLELECRFEKAPARLACTWRWGSTPLGLHWGGVTHPSRKHSPFGRPRGLCCTKPVAQARASRARLLHRIFSEQPLALKRQAAPGPPVRLQLIGTASLHLAHGEPIRLERKGAALLALLALSGVTPRARVAALLWPDADDEHARNRLRQRLFRLHRSAGTDVVLAGDALQLAAHVVHDLAALPARLEADPHAAAGELLGNLDFADCSELGKWVDLAREQWNATRRDTLAEIAGRLEGERQIARGLLYAERLVTEDPFMEHAHRRVMRLHYLRGDRSAALAACEHARAVLQRELQVEPGR